MSLKQKKITIDEKHIEWLDKNSINLSDFVRKRIDDAMVGEV